MAKINDKHLVAAADKYLQNKRRWADISDTVIKPEVHKKHKFTYRVTLDHGQVRIFKSLRSPWEPYYLWEPVKVLDPTAKLRKLVHAIVASFHRNPPTIETPGAHPWNDAAEAKKFWETIGVLTSEERIKQRMAPKSKPKPPLTGGQWNTLADKQAKKYAK